MRCAEIRLVWAVLMGVGLLLAGCDAAPPASSRGAATRPTPSGAAPAEKPAAKLPTGDADKPAEPVAPPPPPAPPAAAPTTPESQSRTETSRPASQPPEPPPPPEPPVPGYIQIIEKFDPKARTVAQATAASGQQLDIMTQNVKRMRIDRDRVPVDKTRSIALMLDGQPLEWLPRSKVEAFERSINGRWQPVKPNP